jgi:hypothetical protein
MMSVRFRPLRGRIAVMLHPLVIAQLRQLGLDPESPPDREAWKRFLEAVSRTQNTPDLTPGGHPAIKPAINFMD